MVIKAIKREECLGCGICIQVCSNDVLRADAQGYPYIAFREDCSACRMCEERCAMEAITVAPGAAGKMSELFAMSQYLEGLGINNTGWREEAKEEEQA